MRRPNDWLPDVRDGLNRVQRIVLHELYRAQRELGREYVPTVMLYGRVVELVDLGEDEFQAVLRSLGVTGEAAGVRPPPTR
ncbi:MAG: hypothetical protein H6983_05215 [Ectothiorhodospiraceae bacterium]|nr:hypothetical protein [Ectothiorhodospiraceae bacterium]